jgi:hypothetical protein
LDVSHLCSLTETEAFLVESAAEREISPSDSELQDMLGVGRARLSQLCNGLNRSGILGVRKRGRTRLFRISRPAEAHLLGRKNEEV